MANLDPDVEAVKAAMQKHTDLGTSSYANEVRFQFQDRWPAAAPLKAFVGYDKSSSVFCYLEAKDKKPFVQLWRENGNGQVIELIPFDKCLGIELIQPLSYIVRNWQFQPERASVNVAAFLKACFIAKGLMTCESIKGVPRFLGDVRRATRAIVTQKAIEAGVRNIGQNTYQPPSSQQNNSAAPEDSDTPSDTGSNHIPEAVDHATTSADEASHDVREHLLEGYIKNSREQKEQNRIYAAEQNARDEIVAEIQLLADEIKTLRERADFKKRKLADIDEGMIARAGEMRRLKTKMTGPEGYELAKREMQEDQ